MWSSSDGEKVLTLSDKVFYAGSYINREEKNMKGHKVHIPFHLVKRDWKNKLYSDHGKTNDEEYLLLRNGSRWI